VISPDAWLESINREGIDFFAGVPDSLLKNFLTVLSAKVDSSHHIICANEGNAIALACGYYMGSGKIPLVYMQNSGLGNAVNPLMSLAHSGVYGIPLTLLIGWRGKPEETDEPQHLPMGKATTSILDALSVPYQVMRTDLDQAWAQLKWCMEQARMHNQPAALLCPADTFEKPVSKIDNCPVTSDISREQAILSLLDQTTNEDIIVATTGFIGRQLLACRKNRNEEAINADFLNVGAMGHASQIALGLSLSQPHRRIICLDGDGALIMHMGSLAIIGQLRPNNLKHFVLNNGMHESVGGQATAGAGIDIAKICQSCGYPEATSCDSVDMLKGKIRSVLQSNDLSFLEIKIRPSDSKLPRPQDNMHAMKDSFMAHCSA
jgi:phosphonopyruvate decarboxylase